MSSPVSVGNIFISHKYDNASIGRVIADFLRTESGNRVTVFFSSDPQFKTPRAGRSLDAELQEAIGECGVMIFIYTGMSQQTDWSFCMYECGYATSKGVPVYVFQCKDEAPAPLHHLVRIRATDKNDIRKFVSDFLTNPHFFPNQAEKITHFPETDPTVQSKSKELYKKLTAEIHKILVEGPREWSPWPFLRLRISGDDMTLIQRSVHSQVNDRYERVLEMLKERAIVVESKRVDSIFGLSVDDNDPFRKLISCWQEAFPSGDFGWLNSLCDQVCAAVNKSFFTLKEKRICQVNSNAHLIPVIADTLTYPNNEIEFKIHFYDIQPRSPLVREVMIGRDNMYYHCLHDDVASKIEIRDLYSEMMKRSKHRLPILDKEGRIVYMIHRSMITEFVAQSSFNNVNVESLKLEDLLENPSMRNTFEDTFIFVTPGMTLEDTRQAMQKAMQNRPGVRDVFVTLDGTKSQPVLGMLTNIDVVEKG